MVQIRLVAVGVVALALLTMSSSAYASASVGCSSAVESTADGTPLDGMLPRQQTLTGVMVNVLAIPEPGSTGWSLQRQARLVPLDVSNIRGRVGRFQGQRVRIEGHFVNQGIDRTFIVTRIRRA